MNDDFIFVVVKGNEKSNKMNEKPILILNKKFEEKSGPIIKKRLSSSANHFDGYKKNIKRKFEAMFCLTYKSTIST